LSLIRKEVSLVYTLEIGVFNEEMWRDYITIWKFQIEVTIQLMIDDISGVYKDLIEIICQLFIT
jgi:hypothetical protein